LPCFSITRQKWKAVENGIPEIFPVTVTQVKKEKLEDYVSVIGTLVPFREVVVGSETQGNLTEVHFEVGDHVYAGNCLQELTMN